jgi:hypothetical protein
MSLETYYREKSEERLNEILLLNFRLGFVKGSLAKLDSILNSGKIQTDEFTMKVLKELTQAYQTSEERAKENLQDFIK